MVIWNRKPSPAPRSNQSDSNSDSAIDRIHIWSNCGTVIDRKMSFCTGYDNMLIETTF